MKYCYNCGAQIEEGANFCSACGKQVNVQSQDEVKPEEPVAQEATSVAEEAAPVVEEAASSVQEDVPAAEDSVQESVSAAEEEAAAIAQEAVAAEEEATPAQDSAAVTPVVAQTAATAINISEFGKGSENGSSDGSTVDAEGVIITDAKPVKPSGKNLTGFILGICGLATGAIGVICAFLALIPYVSILSMFFAIYLGIAALGCSIPGLILSKKGLKINPENKKGKLGRTFSFIGIICGGFALIFGIIFGFIGMVSLVASFAHYLR